MWKSRIRWHILFAFPLLGQAVGCQVLQPSVPIEVTVRDAETRQPIPGATVAFLYPAGDAGLNAHDASATADATGVAEIKAVSGEEALPQVTLGAPGYLPEKRGLPGDALRALRGRDSIWPSLSTPDTVPITLELYHGPDPVIDMLVPPGYRGPIRVDVRVREDVQYQPGLREFQASVPSDGRVQLEGPPILRHGRGPTFVGHYLDEARTKIPTEIGDNDIGLRWVRAEGRTEVFVIGTKADYEIYRRAGDHFGGSGSSDSSGGKSGKGGGGGRRGGGGGGGY